MEQMRKPGSQGEGSRREKYPGTHPPAGHTRPPTLRVTAHAHTHRELARPSGGSWLSGKNAGSGLTLPRSLPRSERRQRLPHVVIPD